MKSIRLLGFAFIFQFFTSLIGNAVFKSKVIFPAEIEKTLILLRTDNTSLIVYIGLSVGTALGVMYLGYMLYKNLRHLNRTATLAAFIFYILEGVSLLLSLGFSHALLLLANTYQSISNAILIGSKISIKAELFAGSIHMLLFCLGAIIFYYYLYKSKIVIKAIAMWGLVCIPFLFIFTVLSFFNINVPFAFYLPYVPFEFVIGIVLVLKNINPKADLK